MRDGIENAMRLNPRPDPGHQIIHIYYPTPEAIDRIKRPGIMANVQSTFIHFEGDTYISFHGKERGACVKPLKTLISKGSPWAIATTPHRGPYQRASASGQR